MSRNIWNRNGTLTVPSDEALMMWEPSGVKDASFTNDKWPFNSFSVFPVLSSWILKMVMLNSWVARRMLKPIFKKRKRWFLFTTLYLTCKSGCFLRADKRAVDALFLAHVEWLGADELNHDKKPHTSSLGGWLTVCKEFSRLLRVEEHVAALCLSTWFISCTHTAHVPPILQRGSAHTPPGVKNNIQTLKVRGILCIHVCKSKKK